MVSKLGHLIFPITGFKASTVPKLNGRFGPRVKRCHTLANIICNRIADGESVNKLAKDPDMPCRDFIWRWTGLSPWFKDKYERAVLDRAENYAEEIIEIADEATDGESAQCARVRVDARKWVVSKLLPKVYGDQTGNVQVNVGVNLALPEQDRLALIERREKLLAASAVRTVQEQKLLP